MNAAKPTHEPDPGRSRWRSALIRLLGGSPPVSHQGPPAPSPDSLPLPQLDPPQLRARAHHFFRYGEALAQRGAPDLAAPFYRQAFTLLEASVDGVPAGPEPFGYASVNTVPPPAASTDGMALPASGAEGSTAPDLAATLARLRQGLNRDTAERTLEELQVLHQQGVRHVELYRLSGLAHLMRNDHRQAESDFRQALTIDPAHYGVLVNLAGVLLASGVSEEAGDLLRRALQRVDPDSPEAVPALTNLSLVEEQVGRKMESAQLVLRVHRLQPGHIRSARLLQAAATLEEMGEDVDAIELLSWLRQRQPEPEVLRRLAALLERRGEYQEAALVYRDLLGSSGSETSPSA
jgi:tetratricopeptide (TPR) repeat protein